jgi:hypothetical protein
VTRCAAFRFAEEDTPPYAGEGRSESLEHGLSLHVVAELFKREIAIPIALDGQALTTTFLTGKPKPLLLS